MKTEIELLSPVQDFVSLTAAINAGADAVYFGLASLNMRMGAKNFASKDLGKIVNICHKNGVKAYLAMNTICYDDEQIKIKRLLENVRKCYVDAIIAWDFSVIYHANKLNVPIHISTQASIANFYAIKSLKNKFKNIERVVLARELSLSQIKYIVRKLKLEKIKVDIEVFIHGAMCVSVSGRCFMSQDVFGKSANRGECLQSCRRKYKITDIEEGHEFMLGENYVMSPKDLCTLPLIDKLVGSGIRSFKIEGRNRSPEYVKVVTECYRDAIDNPKHDWKKLVARLKTVYNRGFSTGFYMGKPVDEWSKAYGTKASKKKVYVGIVKNFFKHVGVAEIKIESSSLKINDIIMIQGNKTGVYEEEIESIQVNKKAVTSAKKGLVCVKLSKRVRENDRVYVVK